MSATTPTVTVRLDKANTLVVALASALGASGSPVFAPHAFPGLRVGEEHPIPAFFDEEVLAALRAGDALRVWAGTERVFVLDTSGQDEGTWRDGEGALCPFGALTLGRALDSNQKAWLREDRSVRHRAIAPKGAPVSTISDF